MAFVATAGFNAETDATLSSGAVRMLLVLADANELAARLGVGGFTYLQIQDGLSYEIVRATLVQGNLVSIDRAIDGTSASAFPRGSCVSFVMGPSSVAAIGGGGGGGGGNLTLASTNPNTALINGASSQTLALPGPFNITVPQVSLTGAGVSGSYPNFVIAGSGGAPSITTDVNLTINGVLAGNATAFPMTIGIGENWANRYGFGSFDGAVSNNDAPPAVGLTPYSGVTSPNTGLGVISGLALNRSGRVFGVEVQTLPNGSFSNATVVVANGRISSVSAGGGGGGGGSVTSVASGNGILITGVPTVSPVVNIAPSGVVAGTYGGVTIDNLGRFTAVPLNFDPVSVINSPTVGVTINATSPGVRQLTIASATSSTQGLVEFADNTQLSSFSSGVAIAPADFRTMLNATGRTVTQSFTGGGLGGTGLTNVAASVNIAGPHEVVLINASVQYLDPSLGAGLESTVPFAAGIYVNGAAVAGTDSFPGGLKTLSALVLAGTGLVEIRTTTPSVGQLVTGVVSAICLNAIP